MLNTINILGLQILSWWSLVDLLVFVVLSAIILMFFNKRNSIRIAFFIILYSLFYLSITIANIYLQGALWLTERILNYVTIALTMCVIIVYRQDIKVIFNKYAHSHRHNKYDFDTTDDKLLESANEIVKACQSMAKNDIGALIILAPNEVPTQILETGTEISAKVSAGLIESIFNTKSPLHDGAVFIKGDKILSAGCFLPLSQEIGIAKELGTRHRAAIGVTEEHDVFAIVVSEETSIISVARSGKIKRYMTPEKLLEELKQAYGIVADKKTDKKTDKKRDRKFL